MKPHPRIDALASAELGYPVFPCKRGSKEPATSHGFRDATSDAGRIRELFRAGHNLGTPGTASVLIIDFDVSKDERIPLAQRRADTRQVLRMMEDAFHEVADAPLHGTPSGGYHVFLRLPVDAPRLVTGAWPRGAERTYGELRGMARAYVVLPPSTTPTGAYTALRPLVSIEELPVASAGLLAFLDPPREVRRREPMVTLTGDRLARYVAAAVLAEHDRVAAAQPPTGDRPGNRNQTLHLAAVKLGTLVGAGVLTEVDAADALAVAANSCGLPDLEATRTIRSGLTYGKQHPRDLGGQS